MRYRKLIIIIGCVITWSYLIYYFLVNSPHRGLSRLEKLNQNDELEQLMQNIRNEYEISERLMKNFYEMLKYKDSQTSSEFKEKQQESQIKIIAMEGNQSVVLPNAMDDSVFEISADHSTKVQSITLPPRTHLSNGLPIIPILVFACNRISIAKCLDNLLEYRPSAEQFPIIVSQDCGDEATRNVIMKYVDEQKVMRIEQPDQSDIFVLPKEKKFKGYYKIARHYGWALNNTFHKGYEYVIIVEDDLNVAPDFYEYFSGTHQLLKQDPTLWCISAWNDNGKVDLIDTAHPELLYRTDFFPGLGWMLTKDLWNELSVKWPKSFWDDWIRHPEQRKNRVCIRPEVSRTRTFGKIGVSNGLFFDKHLRYIKLSDSFVPFTKMNLSYLLKDNYDKQFLKDIYMYPVVTYDELRRKLISRDGAVRIQYSSREQYKRITKLLGLMDDFKSGVPRTAYHGIVSFFYDKRRVYLAPNVNWKGYDLSWS